MVQFRELTERYKLEKILKSTRGGTVLKAVELSSGRALAIKLIPLLPSTPLEASAAELERLAGALQALRHPALPTVADAGITSDGSAFLAMELLEGRGLDALTGAPPIRLLSLLDQALSGLEALASQRLAHGNLSPDNLFLATTPEGERVKLLGLGSAIFRPGAAPADWRSDVAAFADTACRLLGMTVGSGDTPVVQTPLSVSFALENDEALRQVLERALKPNPAERPTFREIRQGIRLAVGRAGAPTPGPRPAAPAPLPFQPPAPAPVAQAAAPPRPMPVPAPPPPPAVAPPPLLAPGPAPAASAPALRVAAPPPPMMSPSAPAPAPAAPETPGLLEPAAEKKEELLLDDDLLNALMAPPPTPPQPEPSPGRKGNVVPLPGRTAAPVPGRPQPARPGLLRRPAFWGAVAGLVLLAGGSLGAFWYFKLRPEPKTAAAPARAVPPGPPQRPAAERLEEALTWFASGEESRARLALESFTAADQASLSPARCRAFSALEETLALLAVENLPQDLSAGLAQGDLGRLRTAVRAGEAVLAGLAPEVRESYEKAKNVVEIYEQARTAAKEKKTAVVLERFASLDSLLPALSDPEDLRNKAAVDLESKAEALAREAKYDAAIQHLTPLITTWPDRSGLKDRVLSYETYKENEAIQERLLAQLPTSERRKKPHEGLEAIAAVEPTPHLAPRFAEIKKRLEEQLAALDRQPPQVILRDGYFLEYARGTVHELSFRVSDDYLVQEVKFYARPQGGRMRELPLEVSRTGYYTVLISPEVHQNGAVEFYVAATDFSGHRGSFGTEDRPQVLNRQQGFNRIVQ